MSEEQGPAKAIDGMTTIAIMQPYFCPYIGYFQLIRAADVFVVYDNIKYTKKGWINRNRLLANGEATTFSLPIKKDSDALDVRDRWLAEDFDRRKLLNRIRAAYQKAPFFEETFPLVERVVQFEDRNLFSFIYHSLREICVFLGITTSLIKSSDLAIDHELKSQDKVIGICQSLRAESYVNPIGGRELYSKDDFRDAGLELKFLETCDVVYRQFDAAFVEFLSIVDVMMFNPRGAIMDDLLGRYRLQ